MHRRLETFVAGPENGLDKLTLVTETLVCYQGGGYAGCIFEWNYAFLDKQGKFHDLFSSGRNGCETEDALVFNLNETTDHELIPISNIQKFINEYATLQIQEVVRKLNNELDYNIPIACQECGQTSTDMDDVITEHKASGFFCMSCYLNDEEDDDI